MNERQLSDWIENNISALSQDRYDRNKNLVVARELYNLFEKHPNLWNTLPHLGKVVISSADMAFDSYLKRWEKLIDKDDKKEFKELKRLLMNSSQ